MRLLELPRGKLQGLGRIAQTFDVALERLGFLFRLLFCHDSLEGKNSQHEKTTRAPIETTVDSFSCQQETTVVKDTTFSGREVHLLE